MIDEPRPAVDSGLNSGSPNLVESGINVLLVDDRHENLVALAALLGDLDAQLVYASSGAEALKRLLEMPFALILLDIQMPGMDGFETAQLIHDREKTRHIPIIFLTAIHTDEAHRSRGYQSGAVDYIFKPFDAHMLRTKVACYIEIGRKRSALEREIARRHEVELELRRLKDQLEQRVEVRTRELQEANYQLVRCGRAKDEFLTILAHELRNPLAPIVNVVELWRRGGCQDSQAQEQALQLIARELHQLTGLIEDLLDVASMTVGKMELHKKHLPLKRVIRQALEASRPLTEAHGHQLSVVLPERDLWVHVDPERFSQAIANLLNNAATYTDDGGTIELSVRVIDSTDSATGRRSDSAGFGFRRTALLGTESAEEGRPWIAICVRDNGIGIPEEMLERIFEPLFQSDCSLQRVQAGLRTGLALAKHLVELHGGTVTAYSAGHGHGSEFTVCLPGQPPPVDAVSLEDAEAVQVAPATKLTGAGVRLKVLVVDDNIDAAESLAALLTLAGHSVRSAHDGAAALAEAVAQRPEAVVCDLGLPDFDGCEVARRLRSEAGNEGLCLVALSGYSQAQHLQQAYASGFDHYLVKPVDVEKLLGILKGSATASPPSTAR